ncbi:MAG: DinB family protein [Chloroflexi bacterium]|nr:DinB family protein [Chloroflexota bacterium]
MELRDFINIGLDRARQKTLQAIDGLTHDEIKWRPGPGANSIGIILLHQARSEDIYLQSRILGKPQVWELEKWYEKMNLPLSEEGAHYTVEQVNAFRAPEPEHLVAYGDVVRSRTVEYLMGISNASFDKTITVPRRGNISVGDAFALIIFHTSEHAGDISFLRGLQRGMDK